MLFHDSRPSPHNNPSPVGILGPLTRFAMESVSANVLLDDLAYRDMMAARAEIRALMATGKAVSNNMESFLGAVK